MTRQLVLDTETTGLEPREGHRVLEVAAIKLELVEGIRADSPSTKDSPIQAAKG
ncbi:MAG: exonuclease domain-containing protein [Pseudomonadota bacterium]